jgi:hypothetical protein
MSQDDLKKMLSVFLSELDALSDSLAMGAANRASGLPAPADVAEDRAQGPPDPALGGVDTQKVPSPANRMPVRNIDILLMNDSPDSASARRRAQEAAVKSISGQGAHPSSPRDDRPRMTGWASFRSRCSSILPTFKIKISIAHTKRLK